MKLLFSATPAFGHILPLVPLMQAAADADHAVGLLSSAGFRDTVSEELPPEVEYLEAGALPGEFSAEAARRTGADVFHPTPPVIGEIFGGARVDLGLDDSIAQAAAWSPDVVLAEPFDAIGPLVAARLGIAWHQAGIGPALPAVIADEINRAVNVRYERLKLRPIPASSYLDPCPSQLQDPGWSSDVPVRAVRPQAHRRPKDVALDLPAFDKPTVLVTLGTIFSAPETLSATVEAVTSTGASVIATLGSALKLSDSETAAEELPIDSAQVRYVPFVPLDQLLAKADLVVGAGGIGTIVGALAHGLPMVVWPQGADQPINADRVAASGASITVHSAAEISGAVSEILRNEGYRERARKIAAEIAVLPSSAEVIEEVTAG